MMSKLVRLIILVMLVGNFTSFGTIESTSENIDGIPPYTHGK